MSVYIITDREAGLCKIGYSKTPLKRLTMLRTSSAADLQLEAVIPGDRDCEADLHAKHSHNLVRREWFNLDADIDALIQTFPRGSGYRSGKPRTTDLAAGAGISKSYASEILSGTRTPSRPLAIHIMRTTGWRHTLIADLSDDQIAMLEQIEPFRPSRAA